jgi:hypothetical protein
MKGNDMRFVLATFALMPLAACTIAQSDATAIGPAPGTCHAEALAQFAGQPASQPLGTRMLTASGARVIRWVPKGGVVTMDFRADRITAYLDGSNRIERASCG